MKLQNSCPTTTVANCQLCPVQKCVFNEPIDCIRASIVIVKTKSVVQGNNCTHRDTACKAHPISAARRSSRHTPEARRAGCMRSRDSLLDHPKLHICHHVSSHLPSSDEHFTHLDRSNEASDVHLHKLLPKCTRQPWTNQHSSSTLRTIRLLLSRWPSSRTSTLWMQSKRSTHTTSAVLLLRARGSIFVKSVLRARRFTISSLSCTSPQTASSNHAWNSWTVETDILHKVTGSSCNPRLASQMTT